MDGATRDSRLIRFSVFELDRDSGELFKQGRKIKLQGQPFELLVALLERPGEVLTREELRQKIWPSEVAGDFDQGLNRAINKVREALGDSAEAPRFIETIPRRGYRFIGPLQSELAAPVDVASAPLVNVAAAPPELEQANAKSKPRKNLWIFAAFGTALLIAIVWLVSRPAPAPPTREINQEQLTFNPPERWVQSAAISPDGRYFAYSDAAGIHVRLLATHEERLIPRPPGVSEWAFWTIASWLPDGTQMLANVIEAGGQNSTWTVSVLGESARELRDGAFAFAVSPDGKYVAFAPRKPQDPLPWAEHARDSSPEAGMREIWLMDSDGDNPRKAVDLPHGQFLYGVHWSPDGKRLAYVRVERQTSGSFLWSIESCALNGIAHDMVVPPSALVVDDFCWLSDKRIVFSKQSSPSARVNNLYVSAVDSGTGKPITKPARLAGSIAAFRLASLSATADSKRLVLIRLNGRARVYLAEVAGDGALINPPRLFTKDDSSDWPNAWTSDNRAVLFFSDRNGKFEVFKQDIRTETAEPLVISGEESYGPRVSSDGAWVVYGSAPNAWAPGPAKMMRMRVNGGSPQFVMDMFNAKNWNCSAHANFCALLETSQDGKQFTITAFDAIRGRGKLLRTIQKEPGEYASALSPDGSLFAIARAGEPETHVRLLSLTGGADREITVRNMSNASSLDWAAGGNGFYAAFSSARGSGLFYFDMNGKPRSLWQQSGAQADSIGGWAIPSPDGRYLAINGRDTSSNAWMIENF